MASAREPVLPGRLKRGATGSNPQGFAPLREPATLPRSMRAAVLHRPGDLRYETVPTPRPRGGDVVIRVSAAGHCGSDLHRIMVAGTYTFPTIPGHEFAGSVVAVAPDVDPQWVGRRVAVVPLIPCGQCEYCRTGSAYLCLRYDYLGSRSDGGFAEFVRVPLPNLVPLPDAIDDEDGAALEPITVALHGIRRAGGMTPGITVCVLGLGPIGAFAVQWAKVLGAAHVLGSDIDDHKLDVALALGADLAVNPARGSMLEAVREITGGLGADLVVEASGVAEVQRQALDLVRRQGRIVWLGISHVEVAIPNEVLLRKELVLFGSFNSTFGFPDSDWDVSLASLAGGRIRVKPLISHRLSLGAASATYRAMHEGRFPHCKIIFLP